MEINMEGLQKKQPWKYHNHVIHLCHLYVTKVNNQNQYTVEILDACVYCDASHNH